jgi:galactoside O-acetyltransferase
MTSETKQGKTQAAVTSGGSALARYREVIVGRGGMLTLIYFEICAFLGLIPGALGLWLRKTFWPRLFRSCGRGTVFGANVLLRHPHRIDLGERVVISDGCVLDARNDTADCAIAIGDDTILGNSVTISCKTGSVRVGSRGGLGTQTVVHAVAGCTAELGDDLIIGPACYIAAGGNYETSRLDVPMSQQGLRDDEGVRLAGDIWLGARVTVLPGAHMGAGSIAAAGAVVNRPVPERAVVGGVPAKVLRMRGEADASA